MLTECRCGNPVEAKLDTDNNKVMCQSCGKEIENISEFAKNNMRANNDVVKSKNNTIPNGGMQVECNHCHKNIVALLNKKDDKCICSKCGKEVGLSSYAVALLKENGQYEGNIKQDNFVGDDLDLGNEVSQAVQFDENGQLEIVKFGAEVEPLSPSQLLEKKNKAIEESLKKISTISPVSEQTKEQPEQKPVVKAPAKKVRVRTKKTV